MLPQHLQSQVQSIDLGVQCRGLEAAGILAGQLAKVLIQPT